ncbi:MAG: YjgP/YjgQ family permease [Flavobacteriaceae bacterium]|nr:YjgP/YjgQ family permease [Flavobacteriaceae bacterium]
MKILDKYILVSYVKTFISVFIILMFIFVLQTIWLYINELAGKDLDIWVVLKFLWYVTPRLIPLVLPLTILVTSLMVFGNFSENYEFAAMKSTGISLQRAMRSLMVFIFLLAVTAFFFANNVIPYSEYKWQNLRRNIAQVSPSMIIAEGQFSQIGDNFNIKVGKKSGERDELLDDIVIHKKDDNRPSGNYTVIVADRGELVSEEGSNTLSLILNDGNYYEEVRVKDIEKQKRKPFAKSEFEEYAINIDLSEFNDTDIDKENELNNHNMYKINELTIALDSLSDAYSTDLVRFAENSYYRSGVSKFKDSLVRPNKRATDTLRSVLEPYIINQQLEIVNTALNNTRGTLQTIRAKKEEFRVKTKRLSKHEIALHEKYALAVACIILFFVGAPLGAIIRKGGMGLPMVVAIALFLTYHFIGIFAKNSAEDNTLSPALATWMSTIILLPLSIWLTYRATTDQGIVDFDAFVQRIAKLFNRSTDTVEDKDTPILITQQEKAILLGKNQDQLKDVLRNFDSNNYSEEFRRAVIKKLSELGYTEEEIRMIQ